MVLKTPSFWYRKPNRQAPVAEILLTPLSWLYRLGYAIDQSLSKTQNIDIPVICVGNLVSGGTGKTPVAISLMQLIREHNLIKNPYFLTRGYGGQDKGPLMVDYFKHNAGAVGDEALLLAKTAYTVMAKHRPAGAAFAQDRKAGGIILDDGLQNPNLKKDISFAVIDGFSGFGNAKLLPAGPLREPLQSGIARSDAFVLIGQDKNGATAYLPKNKPLFQAHVEIDEDNKPSTMTKYVAFAGLGRPEKFYHTLQKRGYNIVAWHTFPDHYPYSKEDIQTLAAEAQGHGAELLTTDKDLQRIPEGATDVPLHSLPIHVVWDDPKALLDFIRQKIKSET